MCVAQVLLSNIYILGKTGRFKQQRIHGGGDFLKRDSKNNDGSTDEHFDDQFKDDFFFDESNLEETPNETLDDFDDDSGMLVEMFSNFVRHEFL